MKLGEIYLFYLYNCKFSTCIVSNSCIIRRHEIFSMLKNYLRHSRQEKIRKTYPEPPWDTSAGAGEIILSMNSNSDSSYHSQPWYTVECDQR